jgi:hypothetical protein
MLVNDSDVCSAMARIVETVHWGSAELWGEAAVFGHSTFLLNYASQRTIIGCNAAKPL